MNNYNNSFSILLDNLKREIPHVTVPKNRIYNHTCDLFTSERNKQNNIVGKSRSDECHRNILDLGLYHEVKRTLRAATV